MDVEIFSFIVIFYVANLASPQIWFEQVTQCLTEHIGSALDIADNPERGYRRYRWSGKPKQLELQGRWKHILRRQLVCWNALPFSLQHLPIPCLNYAHPTGELSWSRHVIRPSLMSFTADPPASAAKLSSRKVHSSVYLVVATFFHASFFTGTIILYSLCYLESNQNRSHSWNFNDMGTQCFLTESQNRQKKWSLIFFATSSGAGAAWRLGSMFQKAPNSIWWCFSSFLLWWIWIYVLGPACDAGCEVASLIQLNRLLMCIVRMCNLAVGSLRPLEIDLKGFRTKVTTCSVQLDISDHWITGIALVQMQELTR